MSAPKKTQSAARPSATVSPGLEESIAWYAFLALPIAVPLAIGVIPFSSRPFTQNPVIYPKILALALIVSIASVAMTVGVFRGSLQTRAVPGLRLLLLFLALGAASTAFALSPTWAFYGGEFLRVGFMSMVLCAGVYVLGVQLLTTPRRIEQVTWATIAGGTIVAGIALLQSRGIDFLATSRDNMVVFLRGPSVLGNPDYTATYLVVVVVLSAALAVSVTDKRLRLVAWLSFVIGLLAVAVSLTRGAWVGAAVGLVTFLIASMRRRASRTQALRAAAVLLIVIAAAVAVVGPSMFSARFRDLRSVATAGDTRLLMWREAVSVIAQHPLFGTGADSYVLGWYSARSADTLTQSGIAATHGDPHNVVLMLLATLGIPAGIAAIVLVLSALVKAAPRALLTDERRAVWLYSGWWAALLGLCASLVFAPIVVTFVVAVALAFAVLMAPDAAPRTPDRVRELATWGALATLSVVLVSLVAVTAIADVYLRQAVQDRDLAKSRAAVGLAPWHAEAQYSYAYASVTEALDYLESEGPDSSRDTLAAAEKTVDALIAQNPHKYGSHILKAHLLLQWGIASKSPALLQRAEKAAGQALDIYPLSPVATTYRAQATAARGDVQDALVLLERVWNIDPTYTDAGILYVRLLAESGRLPQALDTAAHLKEKYPWDPRLIELQRSLENSPTAL